MAHCQREMYHAQWAIILDDEFLKAYKHGIAIKCYDGIKRRFYPRIFTYSADYPEKYFFIAFRRSQNSYNSYRVLIASIRNLGSCPCPRCLIPLDCVPNMGRKRDMAQRISLARVDDLNRRGRIRAARRIIYVDNYKTDTKAVEDLLGKDSLVPTAVGALFCDGIYHDISMHQNAFSEKLTPLGFKMFDMLVVDLMHEVELGVWKAVFIHLLRLLDCHGESLKHEMDRRQVSTGACDEVLTDD